MLRRLAFLARGNPFAVAFAGFLGYDFIANSREAIRHPSQVDLLVASLDPVAVAIGFATGFCLAVSARATGLETLVRSSVPGPAPLLIRRAATATTPLVVLPILLHVIYGFLTGSFFASASWAAYITLTPVLAVAGVAMGLVVGRLTGVAWMPRSLAFAQVIASVAGVGVFFAFVALPAPADPTSPLNFGLVSVFLPPVTKFNPAVILAQQAVVLAAALALLGVYLAVSARTYRAILVGGAVGAVGMLVTAAFVTSRPSPLLESVPPSHCVGKLIKVCAVPLESRGARLLADGLDRVAEQAASVVPGKVTQGAAPRTTSDSITILRLPGDRTAVPRYVGDVLVQFAGCAGADVVRAKEVHGTLQRLQSWLSRGSASMDDDLRTALQAMRSECSG